MNRFARASFAAVALLAAAPALALTNDHGVVVFTQADVLAGNVTPGDSPGFPVTLSVAGASYRLGSSLTVTSAVNGIEVRANEVTIDMGGFTLAGSGVGRNGITSFNRTLTVRNGTIRGFTLDGVRTIAALLAIDTMVITANGRVGVWVDSLGALTKLPFTSVRASKLASNSGGGMLCGSYCLVENSIVSLNGGAGIYFDGFGGIALGNTVVDNLGHGIYFSLPGGAGNNVAMNNSFGQFSGSYTAMQPNACIPACVPN